MDKFIPSFLIGKYTFVSGEIYDGQWQMDKRHGRGKNVYATGINFTRSCWSSKIMSYGKGCIRAARFNGEYLMKI